MPFALFFLSLFLFLLPWNGTISVLSVPETVEPILRFWKEILLFIIFLGGTLKLNSKHTLLEFFFIPSHLWGTIFAVWIGILFLLGPSDIYALMAARTLLIGILAFFAFKIWNIPANHQQNLARVFVFSMFLSISFGIYVSWFELPIPAFLEYTNLISSWVPGQNLPLYHESAGIPRIQGGSSGPIEFSHITLLALFWVLFYEKKSFLALLIIGFLFFGIMGSLSRGAIIGAILLGIGLYFWQKSKTSPVILNKKRILLFITLCAATLAGLYIFFPEQLLRDGTIQHLLFPIEGIKQAFQHPWIGDLGSVGGSARTENLALNNTDQAFISENVWIDVWLHAGIIGLAIFVMFFRALYLESSKIKPLLSTFAILMMLASLWDMAPISIGFLVFVALASEFNTSQA